MASKLKSLRGEAALTILICLALGAFGLLVLKPKAMHGDSKRAAASEEASVKVNASTDELVAKEKKRSSVASASVVKIGEANDVAPESPSKEFIKREVEVALRNMEPADVLALIESERRKVAVLEGRMEEASTLYRDAISRSERLTSERDAAIKRLDDARAERRTVDAELAQVAAERLGAERQRNLYLVIGAAAVGLWLWAKFTHLSPGQLAAAVSDIEKGTAPLVAIDTAASPLQQAYTRLMKKLRG